MPVLLIDESQHLLKMASARRLLDQMDALKSISNITGVKIVLFGNYELLRLGQLSDQLARRCREIHFQRYRLESATEALIFRNVLGWFQSALPIDPSLNLPEQWTYLYRGSLGAVGNLKGWLESAFMTSLCAGRAQVCMDDLRRTCRSEGALTKMAEALREGETEWAKREAHSQTLDSFLGLETAKQITMLPMRLKNPAKADSAQENAIRFETQ